jgi:hypothetical protein
MKIMCVTSESYISKPSISSENICNSSMKSWDVKDSTLSGPAMANWRPDPAHGLIYSGPRKVSGLL